MKLASATALGVPEAKDLARRSDADYILYGSAAFKFQPPTTGMIPEKNDKGEQVVFFVTGEYDLQMFEVSTGRQLAKVAGKFDQKNMNQIQIQKSYAQTAHDFCKRDAPRIVGELRNPVLEYLRNQDVNGADLRIKVSGLKDFGEVADFEKAMEGVANVKGISANGDFDKGTQEYEITYLGKALRSGPCAHRHDLQEEEAGHPLGEEQYARGGDRQVRRCCLGIAFAACAPVQNPQAAMFERAGQAVSAAQATSGDLKLRCVPPDALVLLDGVPEGNCDDFAGHPKSLSLGSRMRKVEIRKEGYTPFETYIEPDGTRAALSVTLNLSNTGGAP